MRHGAKELDLIRLLRRIVTERGCDAAISKDIDSLLQIVDVDHARRDFDDPLHELLAFAQLFFGLPAHGDVSHHFHKAAQPPIGAAQRGRERVCQKARTVLSPPPTLLYMAPCLGRDLELAPRLASLNVLWEMEDGEIPPDDFIRPIAFDPHGAGVPTDHTPLGVE